MAPNWTLTNLKIVDRDDERPELKDPLVPVPSVPNKIIKITETSYARKSNFASHLSECCDGTSNDGVAVDAELVIVDSCATETVGSPEALQSVLVWMQTPHGWFSTYVIQPTGVPMLISIKKAQSKDICYVTIPTQKHVDASDNFNPSQ